MAYAALALLLICAIGAHAKGDVDFTEDGNEDNIYTKDTRLCAGESYCVPSNFSVTCCLVRPRSQTIPRLSKTWLWVRHHVH